MGNVKMLMNVKYRKYSYAIIKVFFHIIICYQHFFTSFFIRSSDFMRIFFHPKFPLYEVLEIGSLISLIFYFTDHFLYSLSIPSSAFLFLICLQCTLFFISFYCLFCLFFFLGVVPLFCILSLFFGVVPLFCMLSLIFTYL